MSDPAELVITIGNKKNGDKGEYVGRSRMCHAYQQAGQDYFIPSPLGNPFRISSSCNRNESIKLYQVWLADMIRAGDPAVCGELDRLYKLACAGPLCLVCWCSPLPCHAEVIKETILEIQRST